MARHQKSLLEAFQKANDERAGGDPASAGPFAGTPTTELQTAERRNLLPTISARDSRVLIVFAGWGLLSFVIGVLAGRQFGGGESLASESDVSLNQAITTGSTVWVGSELTAGEEVNAAIDDSDNLYTVMAFTCPASDEQAAWEHYYNLRDLGVPVAYPLLPEDQIYLPVGAEGTSAELADLLAFLHSAGGPGGESFAYAEAYVVEIDRLIER